jgi:hypothetical protein
MGLERVLAVGLSLTLVNNICKRSHPKDCPIRGGSISS